MENLNRYSPTPVVWMLAVGLIIFQLMVIHRLPPLQSKTPPLSVATKIHLRIKPIPNKVQPIVKKQLKPTKQSKKPKAIAQAKVKRTPVIKKNIVKVISPKKISLPPKLKIPTPVKIIKPKVLLPVQPVAVKPKVITPPRIEPIPVIKKIITKMISPKKPSLFPEPKISPPVKVIQPKALPPVQAMGVKAQLQPPPIIPPHPPIKSIAKPKTPNLRHKADLEFITRITRKPLEHLLIASKSPIRDEKVVQKPKEVIPIKPLIQKQQVESFPQKQFKQPVTSLAKSNELSSQPKTKVNPEDIQRLGSLIKQYIAGIDLLDYYPRRAIKRKLKGKVLIALSFDSRANLKGFDLKTTSGYKILDQAAYRILEEHEEDLIASIQQHQFELPHKARISIPIRFALR